MFKFTLFSSVLAAVALTSTMVNAENNTNNGSGYPFQAPSFQAPGFQTPNMQAGNDRGPQFQPPTMRTGNVQAPRFQAPNMQTRNAQAPQAPRFQPPRYRYRAPQQSMNAPQRPAMPYQQNTPARPPQYHAPHPHYAPRHVNRGSDYPFESWMPWNNNGNNGWQPWNNFNSNNSNWNAGPFDNFFNGDGLGDLSGDMAFNFKMKAKTNGHANGSGRGNGYTQGYYNHHTNSLPAYKLAQPKPAAPAPLDTDKDGVTDTRDLCKTTPAGISVDEFGCEKDARIVLRGVNFKTNSDELIEKSLSILDGVSATLTANPQIRIMVEGHTDSDGDDAYNKDLSQRRAQRVVDYLASKNVDTESLIARGFGEEQPIGNNDTAEGKALNRRVELQRL